MARAGDGLTQQYCSSENTGSDYSAVYNIYQSNGACLTQCNNQNYAFAIVQYQNCWCSNYTPSNQQNTGSCSEKCPGYPDDLCGNSNAGLFSYLKANGNPSGTAGGSSSQASSTYSPPSSSAPPSTQPSSTSQSQPTSYSQTSSTVPSSTSSPPSPTSSPPSSTSSTSTTAAPVPVAVTTKASSLESTTTYTPTPITSVQTVMISGAVVTQTVTSTPTVAPASSPESQPLQRKQLSGGAIAGAVIGTLLGVAAIVIGGLLLWRRRKQNDDDAEGAGNHAFSPRRNKSVLSKTGLLSRGRAVSMTERDGDDYTNNGIATGNNSVRHSMLFGAGAAGEGVSPVSPLGSSHEVESNRRYSRPMVYDQRLNPSALFANAEANGSRVSIQDNADYSRPLGVANPDMRGSFDSRISRA
ncbi:hypothetical protein LTR78_008156 [Recurvomyces mirabilis]|uniref:WSC domain-containing protein n=1 Tax=Recurvomyces mirabilis TaxID=574656 RepID=A0AAE0TRZ7_9PEZI|nr:hypothetical protein LTR78_008156 [Recurvomyces mirabilis]KAK5150645.1 hypothetical protein LTS14_009928 [Recurvomyces mirabilis]